jgi:tetratricopeptide (TPR) repeat protein
VLIRPFQVVTSRCGAGLDDAQDIRFWLKQPDKQIAASQLAPNQAAVHLDLGQLYYTEKKWPQAEKEFQTVIQLDPSNPTMRRSFFKHLWNRFSPGRNLNRAVLEGHPRNRLAQ